MSIFAGDGGKALQQRISAQRDDAVALLQDLVRIPSITGDEANVGRFVADFIRSMGLEVVALAKARPGQITYGSGGVGTSPQLAVELLKSLAKIDIVHVPYKGVPPVIQGLLSGEVALGVASLPSAGIPDLVRSGRVRGLALTGAKRSKAAPNVPTIAESGFPGFDVEIWYGMLAPAGTPPDIIAKLNQEIIRILELPVVRERMAAFDFAISTSTPAEFGAYIKKELAQWAKVVKEAGMAPIN